MKNPNLIPTVITDVNGRTTTVHRKMLLESPTSPWSTPPPPGGWIKPKKTEPPIDPFSKEREANPIGTQEEREETLAALETLLTKRIGGYSKTMAIRKLEDCKDGDYLKRVQTAFETAGRYDVSDLKVNEPETINAACAYRHLVVDDSPRSLRNLTKLHKKIVEQLSPERDENGGIKAFEAHLYARDNTVVPRGHTRMGVYGETVDNEDYVELVDQYADSVAQLVEYVSERGYEDFDHEHFEEYLSNGPVASGWL